MSDIPRNCKLCGCLFNVPSAKISMEHCIMKELNTTAFLCINFASKLIKWLQVNSIDPRLISKVNSNPEKNEEHGKKKDYQTVNVGGKTWMAENLAYDDGDIGIYYNPKNKEYYYTQDAAKRVAKKLDWKLPTNKDWDNACEECDGIKNAVDDYEKCSLKQKLKIKLDGCYYDGIFNLVGSEGYFLSSSEYSSDYTWYRNFDNSSSVYKEGNIEIIRGYSVRLVKDKE